MWNDQGMLLCYTPVTFVCSVTFNHSNKIMRCYYIGFVKKETKVHRNCQLNEIALLPIGRTRI